MSTDARLAAAILAGGASQRLGGADKSSLAIGGTSILDRILSAVQPVTARIFAVGDRHGAAARAGLTVVDDVVRDAGALGGIYTAIVGSPCDRTLIVGCDMPFLTTSFLAHLAAITGADVVIPRDRTGWQPLCAIYSRVCADGIRARLDRGERQAAPPPAGVRVIEIGPGELAPYDPEGLLFVNVNTPHDYAQAQRLLEKAGRPMLPRIPDHS
ncbi:MAG TPA: molybdenum cofactor guanylyltransferase [Vicinamibacterales bacterium]|nr:molybdenum cofactor guanylyltransferase [Vicinamibacterales bacterium]